MRLLILGGTSQARELARKCVAAGDIEVVSSLAGVVDVSTSPAGQLRTGRFGGPDALVRYLRAGRFDAVVDATHPFATRITAAATAASQAAAVPLLVLRRPGWTPVEGDLWCRVESLTEAAAALPGLGQRVLLTTGRRSLAALSSLHECWFLVRCVHAPEPPLPRHWQLLLDRGPFALAGERALLAGYRIEVVVTKDSGGDATAAKLTAARERGIPVIMVNRPPAPEGALVVPAVEAAIAWLRQLTARGADGAGKYP